MLGRVILALLVMLVAAAPAGAAPLVRAKANVRIQGPEVKRSFAGFSQEYNIVGSEVGNENRGVNPVLVGLYDTLAAYGGGAPMLRIGGGSQDSTWWNPEGLPKPMGFVYDLHPVYFQRLGRFLDAANAKALIGLNLAANDPGVAVDVVDGVREVMRSSQIAGWEIGNEPYVFPERPIGEDENGRTIFTRPKDYSERDYLREIGPYIRALRDVSTRLPLAAGSLTPKGVKTFLRRHARALDIFPLHTYALSGCKKKKGQRGYPTPQILLQQDVLIGGLRSVLPLAQAARRAGLSPRMTETNTSTCGGTPGVSDRFASALWAADWMFALAAVGVDGVHFHNSSPAYQAFATQLTPNGFVGVVKPLYYGMLMFAEATPHGSRLLPTTYYGAKVRRGNNVKVWGAVDRRDRMVRVAVIHKGGRSGGRAEIEIPFARGTARLKRLRAPNLRANGGVTWGGQGFEFPTLDGRLSGEEQVSKVRRRRGSKYVFELPRASAALLEVRVSRTRASRRINP